MRCSTEARLRNSDVRSVEQLAEIVEDKIGVLQLVDLVGAAHHLRRLERQTLDAVAADGMAYFLGRRQDAGAVDLEAPLRTDQAELDRVPIEAREEVEIGRASCRERVLCVV